MMLLREVGRVVARQARRNPTACWAQTAIADAVVVEAFAPDPGLRPVLGRPVAEAASAGRSVVTYAPRSATAAAYRALAAHLLTGGRKDVRI